VLDMPRKSAFRFMIEFIQEYLDGKNERLFFDLDFNHYLNQNYVKMEKENPDLAECFVFYLAERGFDQTKGLSDAAHREHISQQFDKFKSAMSDGIL